MLTYVDFSLFESPAKVIVNTVNTVGIMGKGIAKEFKRLYPDMFKEYQRLCEGEQFQTGELWLYKTSHKWVLNFPTKQHWRNPSKTEYIEEGLTKFVDTYSERSISSISFPMLGCGNGELDWESQVQPLMEQYLGSLRGIQVIIHQTTPDTPLIPEHMRPAEMKKWLQSEPVSLAFGEVWDDLVAAVGEGRELETISGSMFTVTVAGDEAVIKTATGRITLYREQFFHLWSQIRDLGLCIPHVMPHGLDKHAEHVLPLLALLPYLHEIVQATTDSQSSGDPRTPLRESGLLLRLQGYDAGNRIVSPRQLRFV